MKILNFVVGLAIAVVLSGLFTLGLKAFCPMPETPNKTILSSPPYCPPSEDQETCAKELKDWEKQWGATATEYRSLMDEYNREIDEYNQKVKTHNRNIFIIGNVVGVLLFIAGFLLTKLSAKTALAVGTGTILSGLYATIMGYSVGWNSTDDRLKFFIGLFIATIIIVGSLWIGRWHKSGSTDKENNQFLS